MGEVILLYKGKAVRNFQVYYLKSDNYIAEFDTDDGHYIEGVRTSTPPYIRGDVELGVIDENGDIIPINQLFEKNKDEYLSTSMVLPHDYRADYFEYLEGWFDDDLNYHFQNGSDNPSMPIYEWVVWPEIVRYAKLKGIAVPDEYTVDLSRTF